MNDENVSIDEFMTRRKSVRGNAVFKSYTAKAPASWNPETRTARFVMSAQVKDRDGDIVMTQGIDLTTFAMNPVVLLNHRSSDLIGNWANYGKGVDENSIENLSGDAVLGAAGITPEIDKAAGLVGAGLLRAASIGFIPKTVKRIVMEDGTPTWDYEIITCELVECSIVTIPANPMALAKGYSPTDLAYHLIEEVLDTYAKDPATGLIVPKAQYEAAHKEATGNRTSIVVQDEEGLITRLTDKMKGVLEKIFPENLAEVAAKHREVVEEEAAATPPPADPELKRAALKAAALAEAKAAQTLAA